ncbi:MAG: 3'(2'),5'-bisphosphate nucleotidase CysQ [Gemmatimonadetes bacterium]|nr:3'(2'),5'-bisphosphate nucleotidase CysQ [Gemmatimonadota bacterium]
MSFSVELERACELAREAGRALGEHYQMAVDRDGDPGSGEAALDVAREIIAAGLRKDFPEDALLLKGQAAPSDPSESGRIWMVDPLDGIREFAARNGEFSVLIGLVVGGEPVAGAIYQPTTDLLHRAARGEGAEVERQGERSPLSVSEVSTTDAMVLVASRSHRDTRVDDARYLLGIGEWILSGSVGIKIGLIAERRCDVYVHPSGHTKVWDTCAPEVILVEAGGQMTDCYGAALRYDRGRLLHHRGIVASNGQVHEEVVDAAARAIRGELDDYDDEDEE